MKKHPLLAELLRIFREREPRRDLRLMARTWGVSENAIRNWENARHDGAIPYHQQLKYRDFYAAHPGIALALAEMAELALAGKREELLVYGTLMRALADRVLRGNGVDTLMDLPYSAEEKPGAILVAFIDAVRKADPNRRRDCFRDKAMVARYLKYAEEAERRRKG
jgi:hypothetical protein